MSRVWPKDQAGKSSGLMENRMTEFFDCVICEEDVDPRRAALGYKTCLECGGRAANVERARKATCSAPAFNKGAYQYVTSADMARDLGR